MSFSDHPLWRKPQHYLDSDSNSDHVHWMELFYDLVHVVSIFVLGNYLSHHLGFSGFFVFAALFIVIWLAWFDLSLFNSIYVSTDIHHRYMMSAQIITVMLMSSSISTIDGNGWSFFAMGYAINRFIIANLYRRARFVGANSQDPFPCEMSRNYGIGATIFAVSAFLPQPYGYLLFGAGVVLMMCLFAMPKIGVTRFDRCVPRIGHMAERFALLLLIVAGEGFFKLVITLSDVGIGTVTADVFVNYVIGGAAIFAMCWMYFDFVGNGKPKDTSQKTLTIWTLAHVTLMLSAVCVGVALSAEVKVGFWESYPYKYAVIGCLGLAVYLYSLLVIQNIIELRKAHQFATAKIRWFGIIMAILALILVPYIPAILGNLLWGTALFSQIVIPVTNAYRTLSREIAEQD
ncbi:low temperature requirement protein A [Enterovibrio calviensis]|uniref:low temperature requirement protein A n=1 Tax=Enterovibrio calviensis TaxID=91359 RepID=UPI0004805A96|nr:low temperature requirement protein A [Enterovibrio calviensis]